MFEQEGRRYSGKIVVKARTDNQQEACDLFAALQKQFGKITLAQEFKTRHFYGVFTVAPESEIFSTKEELNSHHDVEWAEVEQVGRLASTVPNDTYFSTGGAGWDEQWGPQKCGMEQLWSVSEGSADVCIAVIDSGIDINPYTGSLNHPDLQGASRYIYGPNYGDPTQQYPVDMIGHGTRMTGIAAAQTNNNVGIAGMNWVCPVYAICITDDQGNWVPTDFLRAVDNAIQWATNNSKKLVINVSLTSEGPDNILWQACQDALNAGAIICAASGNITPDSPMDFVRWPAAYAGQSLSTQCIISVGATDDDDEVWSDSGGGPELLITAPGVDITTTNIDANYYVKVSGTSEACAHVSGYAALLWGMYPQFSNAQVRDAILANAVKLGQAPRDNQWGYGRLSAGPISTPGCFVTPNAFNYPPGSQNTFYRDTAGRLIATQYNASSYNYNWTILAGGGSSPAMDPSVGTPCSAFRIWSPVALFQSNIFYRTAHGDINNLFWNGGSTIIATTWAGPSVQTDAAAGDPACVDLIIWNPTLDHFLRMYYRTYDGRILCVLMQGSTPSAEVWAGTGSSPSAPTAIGDPVLMQQTDVTGGDSQLGFHMFYRTNSPSAGMIAHVWEDVNNDRFTDYWAGPGSQSNSPAAAGDPTTLWLGQQGHMWYRDTNNCIQHVEYNGSTSPWQVDVWAGPGSLTGAPAAKGDPVAMNFGNQQHIWYRDNNDNLQHVWWDGVWRQSDYLFTDTWVGTNGLFSGPAMGADATALNYQDYQLQVFYPDANGNLQHVYWDSGANVLCYQTLPYGQQPATAQTVPYTPNAQLAEIVGGLASSP